MKGKVFCPTSPRTLPVPSLPPSPDYHGKRALSLSGFPLSLTSPSQRRSPPVVMSVAPFLPVIQPISSHAPSLPVLTRRYSRPTANLRPRPLVSRAPPAVSLSTPLFSSSSPVRPPCRPSILRPLGSIPVRLLACLPPLPRPHGFPGRCFGIPGQIPNNPRDEGDSIVDASDDPGGVDGCGKGNTTGSP